MPSVARSKMWFCRIDGHEEFLTEKLMSMLQAVAWLDITRLLACLHKGSSKENPHAHFVIELVSDLQKQSFDARFKNLFKPSKSTDWSTKVWDGADSACSYLFHEDTTPIVNKGFTQMEIDKFIKLNQDVQAVVKVNNEKGAGRSVQRILTKLQGMYMMDNGLRYVTRLDIAKLFIKDIYEGVMYEPGDFRLKALIEEVYIKTRHVDDLDNYSETRCASLFRN